MLPFLTHKAGLEKDKTGVIRTSLERLFEILPKEAISRWGLEPLDIGTLRLRYQNEAQSYPQEPRPFETSSFTVG
jgi:hypothetical protein